LNCTQFFIITRLEFYDTCVLFLQDNNRVPGSPTSLRVPPNGGCEDLDMETEEEDELRARGQFTQENVDTNERQK